MSKRSLAKRRKKRQQGNYKPFTRTLVKAETQDTPVNSRLFSFDFWKQVGNIKTGVTGVEKPKAFQSRRI